ncbi:MAG: pilus assembly protein [Sphingopyxis terrae]|nr:MAG: pilus assembly protein [Sphingopyxis terrae]
MLALYVGLAELALGLRASQKVDLVTHTLSDLTARQTTGGANSGQAGMSEAAIQSIFSAATALMAPLPTANLKMTISEVAIAADSTQASGYKASVNWSVTKNSGTPRPCKLGGVARLDAADVAPVAPNSMPTSYTESKTVAIANADGSTTSLAVAPTIGAVIVSDVIYSYRPGFNFASYHWLASAALEIARTSYAPVRNSYSPNHIQYYMTSGANCLSTP